FVGFAQYQRIWAAPSWVTALENPAVYGILSLIFILVIGFMLAALMDQQLRLANTFRPLFLYPFALSFIVTGIVWQWV
ncbi:sugar ABC transporter permease, partial [Rhizobium ruizarguesonis]